MTGQKIIELVEDIGEKLEKLTKAVAETVIDMIKEKRAKEKRREVI